ncbi:MAG TPA: DEAD/DEAH box helicase [Bacillota bacterium]|nr:DEAD/DEAH box helicase [Bacillota bacterium]
MTHPSLAGFHPVVSAWFTRTFGQPTPPQAAGWPLIASGKNVLLLAPTGSGKTLAAFLKCLDWLYQEATAGKPIDGGVRVLYISPLKALNNDIHRNLELPLKGIANLGQEMGIPLPELTTAVRTGDTPARERRRMERNPPQILITTPESLFLMLSSNTHQILKTVQFIIVDEIHTLFPNKRGAHLAISLERVGAIRESPQHDIPIRIGLSATMRPLDQIAAFLGGNRYDPETGVARSRPVEIVDSGQRKQLDLELLLPVPDLRDLPEKSIWPPIYRMLLELIGEHHTTLIFVNNRRQAEQVTANLNRLSGKEIARTHHGSVAKEVRLEVEGMLKSGKLPCIVATASLELGIDVGFIDLVIQIESPKEVARGLQRVGRAGHIIGLPSKGRIIPKTRADLMEAAAIIREMKAGRVEPAKAPQNCLDILAQQVVALTATGVQRVEEVFQIVRGAYNYRELTRTDFDNVLKMLAGSYETEEYLELRPRLYWDQSEGLLKPDPYGKRLVYSSGGTIPDRGYFGVYLAGSQTRLGELDEEFVYERRLNDRFILGTSLWKIEEIRQDRVLVSPARKGEAMIPFWKADNPGRPFALGQQIGRFYAEAEARMDAGDFSAWLEAETGMTPEAAFNLSSYLRDQKQAVDFLPTDHRLVLEEFSDDLGEWRVMLHSPYGTRVHTVLGLFVKEFWERKYQFETDFVPTDTGLMFQLPNSSHPPAIDWSELVQGDLILHFSKTIAQTPLFGAIFRHCAARALVQPRQGYGKKRTPLWLARLKAGNLLQIVGRYRDFPLVVETYREILQDFFDLESFQQLLQGLQGGSVICHKVRRQTPSPFARTHLLTFVGGFMYSDDTPKGETRLQLFGLGESTLKTLVGFQGWRELFSEKAILEVERKAAGFDFVKADPSPEQIQFWLERLGDLRSQEVAKYFPDHAPRIEVILEQLSQSGKIVKLMYGTPINEIWAPLSEMNVYLAALEHVRPSSALSSLPSYHQETEAISFIEARHRLIRRYIRTHGPFSVSDIVRRYGFSEGEVSAELTALTESGLVESGEYLPHGSGTEWCETGLLKEIHRRSLAQARRDVEARSPEEFTRFLAQWQGLTQERADPENSVNILNQLSYLWLPASAWEQGILSNRIKGYQPGWLDQIISSGQVLWRAQTTGVSETIQLRFEPFLEPVANQGEIQSATDDLSGGKLSDGKVSDGNLSEYAAQLLKLLAARGALSLPQILQQTGFGTVKAWQCLQELLFLGRVTNDTLGAIRFLLRVKPEERLGPRGVLQPSNLAKFGRWSLLEPSPDLPPNRMAHIFLQRYGLLCREIAQAENVSWGELYPALDYLENIGELRRGYFVQDLSGIQYMTSTALDQLRQEIDTQAPAYWAVSWNDPANALRLFPEAWKLDENLKTPAEYVVYESGRPILLASGSKLKIRSIGQLEKKVLRAGLAQLVGLIGKVAPDEKLVVTHFNEEPVLDTTAGGILLELKFEKGYRDLTLWPSQRKI